MIYSDIRALKKSNGLQRVFSISIDSYERFTLSCNFIPASSSYIIDYFLWGYLKSRVYRRKFRKVEELKTKIIEEFESLRSNKHIIKRVTSTINNRISECMVNGGKKIDI